MQLKKGDERATFDPATWKSAVQSHSFRNSREFHEISLVLKGEGKFIADTTEYPFTEGSILITAPGCSHSVIAPEGYKILSVMGRFDKLGFIDSSCILNDNIYNEGRKLAELILYNRFGNEDYVDALSDAYVKYIITNLDRAPKSTTAAIYKIISKMEKNFNKSDLSVGELLDEGGYARDYIREEFFAVTKQTPKKYLNDIRMKNAKAMIDLYGEDMSLGEIAERCGIIDASVFSRIFRKHFGVSPREYRISAK
jgi:AraC-like DNA-binding protein